MEIRSVNNGIIKKIESRNKFNRNFSFNKNTFSPNKPNTIHSSENIHKKFITFETNKSTNIYSTYISKKCNSNKKNFVRLNFSDRKKIVNHESNKFKCNKFNRSKQSPKVIKDILGLSRIFSSETTKNNNLKVVDNKVDVEKKCILPNYMTIKNFNIESSKVIDFFDLNKDNKFFLVEKNMEKFNKLKKAHSFYDIDKKLIRSGSSTSVRKNNIIEDIYPTVFNIEGKRNIKLMYEIDNESKRKRKIKVLNGVYRRNNHKLKKIMILEKNKVENDNYKSLISNMIYKAKLSLLKMKYFKKDLDHLKRKISFKFDINLPHYNLFLNLDY